MKLNFTKMHGCGNDYIYFNCMEQELANPEEIAIALSHRHFAVGGDGIVMICASTVADAKMRMFNIDGSEGKMCGNAIRCVGKYLYDNKIVAKTEIAIETLSGIKYLTLTVCNDKVRSVKVDMGAPILVPTQIPVNMEGDIVISKPLTVDGKEYAITCVSMGNPHAIIFTTGVDDLELEKLGPKFENHPVFPERVNTEFAELRPDGVIRMRVWERGSGETFACGTGACATAVAAVLNGHKEKNQDITISLLGGDLSICVADETVWMTGPATKAFDGTVDLEDLK
ncbi:MAG: diaminopimelate epimerase [Eubacteriales bacterium]